MWQCFAIENESINWNSMKYSIQKKNSSKISCINYNLTIMTVYGVWNILVCIFNLLWFLFFLLLTSKIYSKWVIYLLRLIKTILDYVTCAENIFVHIDHTLGSHVHHKLKLNIFVLGGKYFWQFCAVEVTCFNLNYPSTLL